MKKIPPKSHPIWEKYACSPKIQKNEYWTIHNQFLRPTNFKINIDIFEKQIKKYDKFFKNWGDNRPQLNKIRLGLPLVNLTGSYSQEPDISIGPLNHFNKEHPDNCLLETEFAKHTSILDLKCFDPLNPLKPYMCRSSILKWLQGANFKPHSDVVIPTVNLRLWGTNNPKNIRLRYKQKKDMVSCKKIEPGRLYLIETSRIHDAKCIREEVYQFFLALNIYSYSLLKENLI